MSTRVIASALLAVLLPFGSGAITMSGATSSAQQARATDATIGVRAQTCR